MQLWKCIKPLGVLFLALALWTSLVTAQSIQWHTFSAKSGLPAAPVEVIFVAGDGTLWAGTGNGLYSFFGDRFSAVIRDPGRYPIHDLVETADGSLYAATAAGLFQRGVAQAWHGPVALGVDAYDVAALLVTENGQRLWIGLQDGDCGLLHNSGQGWQAVLVEGIPPCVHDLAEDGAGRLWIATPDRLLILQNGTLMATIGAEDGLPLGAELTALIVDSDGDPWLATRSGVVRFSGLDVYRIYTREDGLPSADVETLLADPSGGVWVGTQAGLSKIVDNQDDESIPQSWTLLDGRIDGAVYALAYDADGKLWVGADGSITNISLDRWVREPWDPLQGISVNALLLGTSTGDYVGTGNGVVVRDPNGIWSRQGVDSLLPGVRALTEDGDGGVWVGAATGLYHLRGDTVTHELQIAQSVESLLLDEDGTLWIGTTEGLYNRHADGVVSPPNLEIWQKPISSLWRDDQGSVWAGVLGLGVFLVQPEPGTALSLSTTSGGLMTNHITAGMVDSTGNLWIGTGEGISLLPAGRSFAERSNWQTYLQGEVVYTLVEDQVKPGVIWAGTDRGLSILADGVVNHFGPEDGLPDKGVLSLGQDADGALWFGTSSGLTYHRDPGNPPQIQLNEPLIDGQPCDLACRRTGIGYQRETVAYRFEGSDLGDLGGIQFEYDFVATDASGKTERAHDIVSTNSFSRTLQPGFTYTFTVRALDRHLNPSDFVPVQVLTVLQPLPWQPGHPLYATLLGFGVVMLMASGGMLYSFVRPRLRYPYLDLLVCVRPLVVADHYQVEISLSQGPNWAINFQQRLARRLSRRQKMWADSPLLLVDERIVPTESLLLQSAMLGTEEPNEERLIQLGAALYTALLSSRAADQISRHLPTGRQYRRFQRQGLRIRLDFSQAPVLNQLPWELLYAPEIGFLGRQEDCALVRYRQNQRGSVQRARSMPVRVLAVMALPIGHSIAPLHLAQEKQQLDRLAQRGKSISVRYLLGANAAKSIGITAESENVRIAQDMHLRDLFVQELQAGWDVVHFAGHAGADPTARRPDREIVLWGEDKRGELHTIGPALLQRWLEELLPTAKTPLVVILAACRTADVESNLVQTFLNSGVAAVVGMQWPVKDAAASAFVDGFYTRLVAHGQVDHAVSIGRRRMVEELKAGQRDWAAPVLISQRDDGQIFTLKARHNHATTGN